MSQMEPVFCHFPETLRLVQVVRLLDECLRQPPAEDARERIRGQVRDLIDRGREIARENFVT
ncbi:MAG TPA: hypothetical protein VE981_08000 [Planctomycetota bacterium]|nr:hypothetical protein [Planctomycetota bacterium]